MGETLTKTFHFLFRSSSIFMSHTQTQTKKKRTARPKPKNISGYADQKKVMNFTF